MISYSSLTNQQGKCCPPLPPQRQTSTENPFHRRRCYDTRTVVSMVACSYQVPGTKYVLTTPPLPAPFTTSFTSIPCPLPSQPLLKTPLGNSFLIQSNLHLHPYRSSSSGSRALPVRRRATTCCRCRRRPRCTIRQARLVVSRTPTTTTPTPATITASAKAAVRPGRRDHPRGGRPQPPLERSPSPYGRSPQLVVC